MVQLITGEKNAGKTSFLERWYRMERCGVGFCSRKVLKEGEVYGYDLLFFPDLRTIPFIRLATLGDRDDPDKIVRHRFAFSRSALLQAEQFIEQYATSSSMPIWMDEIGGLELAGEGFDSLFQSVLLRYTDVRVVFRQQLLDDLIRKYKLEGAKIIRV